MTSVGTTESRALGFDVELLTEWGANWSEIVQTVQSKYLDIYSTEYSVYFHSHINAGTRE